MPGVFEVSRNLPTGQVIEGILLLAEASLEGEWEGQVRYLPLRREAIPSFKLLIASGWSMELMILISPRHLRTGRGSVS